jgi:hypothetical protein
VPESNRLYYGDNLDILRRYIKDESVDLVYLDPPFNSNRNYNVLFAEKDGSRAAAQIKAFEDTWRWDQGSSRAFHALVERGDRVSQASHHPHYHWRHHRGYHRIAYNPAVRYGESCNVYHPPAYDTVTHAEE